MIETVKRVYEAGDKVRVRTTGEILVIGDPRGYDPTEWACVDGRMPFHHEELQPARLTLYLEADEDTPNPADNDGSWQPYSFNSGHTNYRNPADESLRTIGMQRKLQVGLAFWLSYSEHGECAWMLAGSDQWDRTTDKQWDAVGTAGILIWEEPPKNMGAKTYADRYKDATGFIETYTEWVNGHCRYWKLVDADRKVLDKCGGIVNDDEGMFAQIREHTKGLAKEDVIVKGDSAWLANFHAVVEKTDSIAAQ